MILAAALVLVSPVSGLVTDGFRVSGDPFAGGQHRGADFAAPPGTAVRAACEGVVAFAGPAAASGRVVTLRCGGWRVTHLPLATIAVRRGERVRAGAELGTAGRSSAHAGLHLGVRSEGERFGYADPLGFMTAPRPPSAPPLGPAPRPTRPPRAEPPARRTELPPRAELPPRTELPPRAEPAPRTAPSSRGVAPWPAWAGLALVLAGAGVGSGRRARRRGDAITRQDEADNSGRTRSLNAGVQERRAAPYSNPTTRHTTS